MTSFLVLFLVLMLNEGIAQRSELAHLSRSRTQSQWVFSIDPERVSTFANPLTTRFSVLPRITVNDDGNLFVYIFNPNRIGINVHFHDEGGNALYHDKTAERYYGKLLNFSELGDGEYELTLHSDTVSAKYVVKIGSETREIKVKPVAE